MPRARPPPTGGTGFLSTAGHARRSRRRRVAPGREAPGRVMPGPEAAIGWTDGTDRSVARPRPDAAPAQAERPTGSRGRGKRPVVGSAPWAGRLPVHARSRETGIAIRSRAGGPAWAGDRRKRVAGTVEGRFRDAVALAVKPVPVSTRCRDGGPVRSKWRRSAPAGRSVPAPRPETVRPRADAPHGGRARPPPTGSARRSGPAPRTRPASAGRPSAKAGVVRRDGSRAGRSDAAGPSHRPRERRRRACAARRAEGGRPGRPGTCGRGRRVGR